MRFGSLIIKYYDDDQIKDN